MLSSSSYPNGESLCSRNLATYLDRYSMVKIKHSVSTRIANYLIVIIIFVGVIASLSFTLMAGNRSYAEAINVSGSLRMQSYRLLYDMEHQPELVEKACSNTVKVCIHNRYGISTTSFLCLKT